MVFERPGQDNIDPTIAAVATVLTAVTLGVMLAHTILRKT